jgi:nicotinamidase-related amidase
MLIDAERSLLLIIDVQEKLLPVIHESERVVDNVGWLVRLAQRLGLPVAATEQYPKGLGPTEKTVRALLPEGAIATKNHFSAVAAQCLRSLPGADRPQVVIAGIEAHVCVLQTTLELLEEGREVYVVADCVSSRREPDVRMALLRMQQDGARIVTREMVAYEWLGEAGTPLFREISKEFLR